MKTRRRIRVPVEPLSEQRWDRVERRLLEERDLETRAPANLRLRPWPRRLAVTTTLVGAALAGMLLVVLLRPRPPANSGRIGEAPPGGDARTVVITPPGAGSTLRLGDAECGVSPDSAVGVLVAADGAIRLDLGRGAVDCDVEPRPGRAPFHVVAADVTVTVVGTRFTVEHKPGAEVHVAVLRGKVRVVSPRGETAVAAGQKWGASSGLAAADPLAPGTGPRPVRPSSPGGAVVASADPAAPDAGPAADVAHTDLATAAALAETDPNEAARHYREIARGRDVDAEAALYRLARLERDQGHLAAAIAATQEYERRFTTGAHLEELLWLRVEANCASYRSDAAHEAARAYLRRFPRGAHAAQTKRDAVCLH